MTAQPGERQPEAPVLPVLAAVHDTGPAHAQPLATADTPGRATRRQREYLWALTTALNFPEIPLWLSLHALAGGVAWAQILPKLSAVAASYLIVELERRVTTPAAAVDALIVYGNALMFTRRPTAPTWQRAPFE